MHEYDPEPGQWPKTIGGINFIKYHANANDFIIIEGLYLAVPIEEQIKLLVKRAQGLCDRHRGIGADGILLVNEAANGVLKMTVINADGSLAANCGNGLRCVAHWWLRKQQGFKKAITIKLGQRSYYCAMVGEILNIDMGECVIERCPDYQFLALSCPTQVYKASLGNQHLVFLCAEEGDEHKLITEIKENFSDWADFNIGLIFGERRQSLVYERGVGFTQSCGSGAIAAAAALRLNGSCEPEVKICQPGGEILVSLHPLATSKTGVRFRAAQSGTATEIYQGHMSAQSK